MNEIFLGLDIGTNSCGWALTDDRFQLKKINGFDAWGVRLFDEAKTKQERRLVRATRRRRVRKNLQNSWLRELFFNEINKIDNKFFDRLKYSNLLKEDKEKEGVDTKYSLFNDVLKEIYTDKNYYKEYKTVYHLRKRLLQSPADDVRLLYLAIHSILTHRGHFLSGNSQETNESLNILKSIEELFNLLRSFEDGISDNDCQNFQLKCDNLTFIENLLNNFENLKSIKNVKEKLFEDLCAKTKLEKEVLSVFVSGKSTTDKIFARISKEDKIEFDFDSDVFEDETYGKLVNQLSDEELRVIELLRQVFTYIQLRKILGDNSYICEAMVEKYEKHNKQLNDFKAFIKKYFPSKKSAFFRQYKLKFSKNSEDNSEKTNNFVCNYAKYIKSDLENGKKQIFDKVSSQEDFYNYIKKQIKTSEVECEYDKNEFEIQKQYFYDLMAKNDFLKKIRSKENSVIPNGMYVKELKQILKISKEKFKFLNEKDETGLTVADKIISIIEFKVPFFVGPIGLYPNTERVNGWAEKECNLKLYPWTLNKIVDFDKAEDVFIQRMTNKCTYLMEEDVLPKDSLIYSKFLVLNELNKLKINGNFITVDVKQLIFNKLFKKFKKVSLKRLKELLIEENIISKEEAEDVSFSGIDKEFASNYASFVVLSEKFGEDFILSHQKEFEKIIKYHTIISDKSRLEKRLKREFGFLNDTEIKFLKSLNFSKWGRLSEKFLTEIYFINKKTGEYFNIIDALWQTNNNLMELMGSEFTFSNELEKFGKKKEKDLAYEDVEALNCSPAVKRGTWQAIQIINEIKQKIGRYPDKIFVEVTRNEEIKGDAGRKFSRNKTLQKLYNDKKFKLLCDNYALEYNKLFEELNKIDSTKMRSDKIYLYFLQLGKCMYTGETINIEDLFNDNLYDIDHIIPQSKLKDDSLNNRVLVKREANLTKGDIYPISQVCQDWVVKQKDFWKMLNKKGFISDEKFSRLIRSDAFSESDANDFINRQLVLTNQETKSVIDLLKKVIDNPSSIIFSKAKFVSDFRNKYNILKSRDVNAFHHAKDAYLNIVVGDVLYNRFTANFWKREKNDYNKEITANINKLFDQEVRDSRNGSIVWKGADDILKVQQICNKNNCVLSVMPYINNNGKFYDETILKSKRKMSSSKASVNLKGNDRNPLSSIEKYGGYNSLKGAYFMVVECLDKNNKLQKTIENVPILINYKFRNLKDKQQKIIEYLEKENQIKIVKVIFDKLKYNSLLKINNGLYQLRGKTGDRYELKKITQWHVENKYIEYIKIIEKYINFEDDFRKKLEENNQKIIVSPAQKDNQKEKVLSYDKNLELYDLLINQLSKSIYKMSAIQSVKEKLIQERQTFQNLSISEQTFLLNNVIKYIGGATTVDLTIVNGKKEAGKLTIDKKITNLSISLICQSTAGLLQKEIKL